MLGTSQSVGKLWASQIPLGVGHGIIFWSIVKFPEFLGNFPKCWKVGNFPNSLWNLTCHNFNFPWSIGSSRNSKKWQVGCFPKSPRILTWHYFSNYLGIMWVPWNSLELSQIPLEFDMALFSTSLDQWEVSRTSRNFLRNFSKCWQVGNFPKSLRILILLEFDMELFSTFFGLLEVPDNSQNFQNCWKVGNFPQSHRILTWHYFSSFSLKMFPELFWKFLGNFPKSLQNPIGF